METNKIIRIATRLFVEIALFLLVHYVYIHYVFKTKPIIGDPNILFDNYWLKYFVIRAGFYLFRLIKNIDLTSFIYIDFLLTLLAINIYFISQGGMYLFAIITHLPFKINVYKHIYLISMIAFAATEGIFMAIPTKKSNTIA
jgi:hypothetical protein